MKKISKGKYIKPTDYVIFTNSDTTYTINTDGYLEIRFGTKKVSKIIFNAQILINHLNNIFFGIVSNDKNGHWFGVEISGEKGKRQYDGSYTFIIDVGEKDYNNYVQIQKWGGNENIILNYLSLEFDKKYKILDFNAYIAAL